MKSSRLNLVFVNPCLIEFHLWLLAKAKLSTTKWVVGQEYEWPILPISAYTWCETTMRSLLFELKNHTLNHAKETQMPHARLPVIYSWHPALLFFSFPLQTLWWWTASANEWFQVQRPCASASPFSCCSSVSCSESSRGRTASRGEWGASRTPTSARC